jgi:hypothetical protein
MSRSVPSRVPYSTSGFRSNPLRFLASAVLTILLQGCAAGHGTPLPQASTVESEIYAVFSGSDARALAQMGQRLESERPRLSPELVGRMLSFLTSAPPQDPPVSILRPMLFRTVAVVVGRDSKPYLEHCIASSTEFSDLCSSTAAELASARR